LSTLGDGRPADDGFSLDRFGYDIGVISSCFTMPDFIERFGEQQADGTHVLDSNRQSIITSLLGAGTFVGSIAQVRSRKDCWLYRVAITNIDHTAWLKPCRVSPLI
jgi:hypothetical protein